MKDSEKLRFLADWFDAMQHRKVFEWSEETNVQDDLRRIADEVQESDERYCAAFTCASLLATAFHAERSGRISGTQLTNDELERIRSDGDAAYERLVELAKPTQKRDAKRRCILNVESPSFPPSLEEKRQCGCPDCQAGLLSPAHKTRTFRDLKEFCIKHKLSPSMHRTYLDAANAWRAGEIGDTEFLTAAIRSSGRLNYVKPR